ncbi:hypothetical protein [Agromyces seonyuensis]|uniref:NIPSNAP family protein n=1 Tax=Agromyces seonyuensis TaxID=2662446 RepID=A0A6I4P0T6_9MICO|nr:hypothetical protein [Agromyces seonyuensis]MWB99122.1 hypothetical protein [Agromyces seonyuensis]
MRTVQLRRYELKPELVAEFLEWWPSLLVPARRAFGYEIGDAFYNPVTHEFTWFSSAAGDESDYEALDAKWAASPERAAVFAGRSPWTNAQHVSFVTTVSPAA